MSEIRLDGVPTRREMAPFVELLAAIPSKQAQSG
jgi:hypothetical protein